MWTVFAVVFTIWPLLAQAENNFIYKYTNGWVPVSSEIVYDQIKHERSQAPQYIATSNIQLLHTDINHIMKQNSAKPIETKVYTEDNAEFADECNPEDLHCSSFKHNEVLTQEPKYNLNPNIYQHTASQNETDDKNLRRSKKIADPNFKNHAQDLFLPEAPLISKANTYEVTEKTSDVEESKVNNEGYKYEPPLKKNQTNGLFEILSKYKINKDDVLRNYDLSRKHKAQIPSKLTLQKPQNQIIYPYNNLNHLPVNPLLAVLLSNYGLYLQGMYGVNNSYNNLYGYLASNNIHNNRPFVVYKIYSDTDSSH